MSAVEAWRRSPPLSVLVTPAAQRGFDFAGDDCRFLIILKVPFGDSRDPVTKARSAADAEYPLHGVAQTLVQAAGRVIRSPTDWAEIFLIDDQFVWLLPKIRPFLPLFFTQRLQSYSDTIPQPIH